MTGVQSSPSITTVRRQLDSLHPLLTPFRCCAHCCSPCFFFSQHEAPARQDHLPAVRHDAGRIFRWQDALRNARAHQEAVKQQRPLRRHHLFHFTPPCTIFLAAAPSLTAFSCLAKHKRRRTKTSQMSEGGNHAGEGGDARPAPHCCGDCAVARPSHCPLSRSLLIDKYKQTF